MKVIAHRGYWKTTDQKNSLLAINAGMEDFDGVETDIRDLKQEIVISHDMPSSNALTLEEVFSVHAQSGKTLALNIKADGLSDELIRLITKYNVRNYFTFDMSIPEMVVYKKKGIKFYTSLSDVSETPILLDGASGIWLDSFKSTWYDEDYLFNLKDYEVPICVVSEELHGRDYINQWKQLSNFENKYNVSLSLCTDFPKVAKEFFNDN